MLEMKTVCERCSGTLNENDHAYICSFECTFCRGCTDTMQSVCPNCSGELVRRPTRRSRVPEPIDGDSP